VKTQAESKKAEVVETPLMKQYNSIKAQHPDALLLFRVGDFYETFGEDAIRASRILGIVLTRRANGSAAYIELAGFPHHSLDIYLPKLVRAGERVAICDQLEDPKTTKTIVKRGVTELVTPGVAINDKILDHRENNFLASVYLGNDTAGVAFLDISTGEFLVTEGALPYIEKILQTFRPSEVLYAKGSKLKYNDLCADRFYSYPLEDWVFAPDFANESLLKHFGTLSLKGFGIEEMNHAIVAAGAILHYLGTTNHEKLQHIACISRIEEDNYVWLDRFTIRNLELFHSSNEKAKTLLQVIDHTVSPMGSRMLKRWIALPLKNQKPIEERLSLVEHFLTFEELREKLIEELQQMGDIERLISKAALARVNPREVLQLKRALQNITSIKNICSQSKNPLLLKLAEQLNPCLLLIDKIEKYVHPDAPALINKGQVIATGVNSELDELRSIAYNGKDYLLNIQKREVERTGISSLKIAFNNVFGYYLEVTNSHKDKVPTDWIRKQTLVNAERYITEELKVYETKILGAEEKILALETKLFSELVLELSEYIAPIQLNSVIASKLDCLTSFACIAKKYNYVKPTITEGRTLEILSGRHPVIEQQLPLGTDYVPNDVVLDNQTQQIMVITGPNMAGKSALLRQTALIVLMAQSGSFVPAKHATIGLVDKVFTRVGASDNISSGESTFMVEMNETASILNNISDRSLVLLDEIGRGTSTYDGISIAWAIAEYIHEHPTCKAKTLFATHYHELNQMAELFPRIKNFNVSVKEAGKKIIFLRKLVPGGTEHSFGIHVAKMAGMPQKLVRRAEEVLSQLEKSHSNPELNKKIKKEEFQLSIFQLDDPVLEQIKEEILKTDVNALTPLEALVKLNEIKKLIGG
jgi:DNA mismatch repair protein MutS